MSIESWRDGAPDTAGLYWIIWRHSVTGAHRLHLISLSPAIFRPDGRLLLKFAEGECFDTRDNMERIVRHAPVELPALPDDLESVETARPGQAP